ncbi:hypothetical protein C8J57DRAFT_1479081 [Mycena rebaudengoi]|nr:hypothetical protein C8J57DRAFT_1479081 [Mycena rebaudengoi]
MADGLSVNSCPHAHPSLPAPRAQPTRSAVSHVEASFEGASLRARRAPESEQRATREVERTLSRIYSHQHPCNTFNGDEMAGCNRTEAPICTRFKRSFFSLSVCAREWFRIIPKIGILHIQTSRLQLHKALEPGSEFYYPNFDKTHSYSGLHASPARGVVMGCRQKSADIDVYFIPGTRPSTPPMSVEDNPRPHSIGDSMGVMFLWTHKPKHVSFHNLSERRHDFDSIRTLSAQIWSWLSRTRIDDLGRWRSVPAADDLSGFRQVILLKALPHDMAVEAPPNRRATSLKSVFRVPHQKGLQSTTSYASSGVESFEGGPVWGGAPGESVLGCKVAYHSKDRAK